MLSLSPKAALILSQVLVASPEAPTSSVETFSGHIPSLACLVQIVHSEASGEPYRGKVAVANVVMNRVQSERFPDTVCQVGRQESQFSFWTGDYGKPIQIKNSIDEKAFRATIRASIGVLEGKYQDNTFGAKHYVNFDKLEYQPKWLQKMDVVVKVGRHSFLEEI